MIYSCKTSAEVYYALVEDAYDFAALSGRPENGWLLKATHPSEIQVMHYIYGLPLHNSCVNEPNQGISHQNNKSKNTLKQPVASVIRKL